MLYFEAKMKAFLVVILLFLSATSVSGLLCWLCGGGGSSFEDCNTKKTVQNCSEPKYQEAGKGPLNRCAYFSYLSKEKKRVYAKSCTFASYCTETGETFCKNVRGGGATQCQVECCPDQQCNDREQFLVVKTWPPPASAPAPDADDKYWCDWKENNAGCMVSGFLAFAACVMSGVFIFYNYS